MLMNTTLNARCHEFEALVRHSVFTNQQGYEFSIEEGVNRALALLRDVRNRHGSVYLIGNGGSAAVAGHICTDFLNVGGLRVQTLLEPSALTCMANDYGYEQVYAQQIRTVMHAGDLLIAISSSGNSANIVNAARAARAAAAEVFTLTGFSPSNALRALGGLNYWVASDEYGLVEIAHLFALHHLSDRLGVERAVERNESIQPC